uniref:Uncharacterized protein n=1 Tax=Arundo donax TaxID=35708 RepID=A0A0A9ENA0_ARUDO
MPLATFRELNICECQQKFFQDKVYMVPVGSSTENRRNGEYNMAQNMHMADDKARWYKVNSNKGKRQERCGAYPQNMADLK